MSENYILLGDLLVATMWFGLILMGITIWMMKEVFLKKPLLSPQGGLPDSCRTDSPLPS